MRRLLLSLAAAIAVAAPIGLAAGEALADPKPQRGWERRMERQERKFERRYEQRERRFERRDHRYERRGERWDDRRHNGYYYRGHWRYGPPPPAYFEDPYFRPGFAPWRRGTYLPPAYRGVRIYSYDRHHLRPPPAGYAWYRVGDDFLLTQTLTGLILEVVGE